MNDIRRTILWVIFGFSLVMLWNQWQVYNGKPAIFGSLSNTAAPAATAASASAGMPAVPASAGPSGVPAQAGATAPAGAMVPVSGAAPSVPREHITVTTDVLRLTFDTEGGSLTRTEFLNQVADDKTSTFVLLDESAGRTYVAQSGLIGGDFPTHKTVMTASAERTLKEGADQQIGRAHV